jgi:hypothetical protein
MEGLETGDYSSRRRGPVTAIASSPASSGPAGSHFEGQVGAYYLLSMLTGSEPRGLPGTGIDRIELQRAAEGRPLDDVIIHAHDTHGDPAVLEIQVKRSITFAHGDPVFLGVVAQIVNASRRSDFWTSRYELAIATARTSRKIDGTYQDVLTWARQLGDAATFMARIARPGSANDDMRSFVRTFRSHLRDAGVPDDDETVWRLLRKLQILVFDFTARGSASEELAKERAVRALHPDDAVRAGNLWTTLVELALQIAASGGDRTRNGLIEDLRRQSFRLVGDRRYSSARATLAEASRNALADIGDRVGNVTLTRHERVAAVHAALDAGRYVEIRGDAGVGKSSVLKHFAEQIAIESQVVVLTPGRTTPRGWTAMRAVLEFDGTARDLLTDLASNGGAILFVDNLDFFGEEDRRTVVDLVREAADVPGFAVLATARRNFGVEEPNWLPSDALARLGRAEPILIGELNEAEVGEMRHAAPMLAPLLADTHPARDVTRNLFRLARLASRPGDEPVPRTEVDMAEQWWQTADGKPDGNHRERARLLKALAEQALSGAESLNVSERPAMAVNALVTSETLRDLGSDRVAFRHDVLREWAIANLLHSEPAMIERLPLDRPASAALARGVELAARIALERGADSTRWQSLIERLSREGTHGSWRRAVLLALVRSEVGPELLARTSGLLLANRAIILREFIRIVMAVDVQPASKMFAAVGVDPAAIPAGLNVPSGPSWHRLIRWLLSLGDTLPVAAIPDVVNLYTAWSVGTMGLDPLTPSLVQWLYRWLTEIETTPDEETFRDRRKPFGGEIDHDRIGSLVSDLRTGFLFSCKWTPALAARYLRSLRERPHNENAVREILKFRGSLAQAAPAELAELTATALIPKRRPDERHHRREFDEPFDFLDREFLPASPAQGPFFDLLTHAPQHGLSLIHRLVDHAISFHTRGREYGADAITISFSDGERAFPWVRSYAWSREGTGGHYCVTSALMALEAWAHRRIEAGETFDEVLPDLLGPPGSPATYLLVAVDLLLSRWPKSREAAVPFLACPELLCIDRERYAHDNLEYPDVFGLKALEREPAGPTSLEGLKKRASRRLMLDQLLGQYAVAGPIELREMLTVLLRRAAARLGPPDERSDLGDAAFMAVHALNLLDPNNWREVAVARDDGTQDKAWQYVSPEDEDRHLAVLREASRDRFSDANMQAALSLALEDPSRSSADLVAAAVEWAQRATTKPKSEDKDEDWMCKGAALTAAMIAMRDGDAELRTRHEAWARGVFAEALQSKDDPVYRFRGRLRFNPIAIAFVGMTHVARCHAAVGDVRGLLEVAAREEPAAAHGFGVAATTLASMDERLPRAVLRCAFAACIRPNREWDLPEGEAAARAERHSQRIRTAVNAELAWLADERAEPDWPAFPPEPARRRRHCLVLPGRAQQDTPAGQPSRPEEYTDHQAAAVWLSNARGLFDVAERPWLREVARSYAAWTAAANGAGLDAHEEIADPPGEWNNAYFELLAYCLPGLASTEIDELALTPIISLPDEPFFGVMTQFLRSVDAVYFNESRLQEPIAVSIRSALARRLMASSGWKRLSGSRSASIEMHVGPAIATLFFNDHGFIQPAKCYLLPKGVDRLDPFLPVLERLVVSGPSLFVALVTLNLIEVAPKSTHLQFMMAAAKAWLRSYPDSNDFWIGHEIGRRVSVWIEAVWRREPTLLDVERTVRLDVDRLLAALVSLGVADARRLEEALARGPGSRT